MLSADQRDRLGAWVLAVTPRATAYARSLARDAAAADDLVQECLFRLLRKAADYDLERDGVKLLFKAISNLSINQKSRERAVASLDTTADADDAAHPVVDRVTLRPDLAAEGRELGATVRAALQTLPEMQRAAVELRALGMSKDEIADVLGVSATNAGVLVHRGRKALAAVLDAAGVASAGPDTPM